MEERMRKKKEFIRYLSSSAHCGEQVVGSPEGGKKKTHAAQL